MPPADKGVAPRWLDAVWGALEQCLAWTASLGSDVLSHCAMPTPCQAVPVPRDAMVSRVPQVASGGRMGSWAGVYGSGCLDACTSCVLHTCTCLGLQGDQILCAGLGMQWGQGPGVQRGQGLGMQRRQGAGSGSIWPLGQWAASVSLCCPPSFMPVPLPCSTRVSDSFRPAVGKGTFRKCPVPRLGPVKPAADPSHWWNFPAGVSVTLQAQGSRGQRRGGPCPYGAPVF